MDGGGELAGRTGQKHGVSAQTTTTSLQILLR
jgi:hypothetical protein